LGRSGLDLAPYGAQLWGMDKQFSPRTIAALTLALTAAFAIAPALSPSFAGYQPDQLPVIIARHAVQPSGYAFSIWGVIYGWLIVHAGFGLVRRTADPTWMAVRPALIGAAALGTIWLFIAANAPLLATAVILVMAACAITAFLRAETARDRWLLSAPLAIFAGWLSAASLVSVGIMLGGYGILPHKTAALVMLALLVGGGIYIQSRRPLMPVYGATLVWAIIAVAVANFDSAPTLAIAALTAAALTGGATVWLRLGR
jgi:hypothetical protein